MLFCVFLENELQPRPLAVETGFTHKSVTIFQEAERF